MGPSTPSYALSLLQENFPNHTLFAKDAWCSKTYKTVVQDRVAIETDEARIEAGLDEFGNEGETIIRFSENMCVASYLL